MLPREREEHDAAIQRLITERDDNTWQNLAKAFACGPLFVFANVIRLIHYSLADIPKPDCIDPPPEEGQTFEECIEESNRLHGDEVSEGKEDAKLTLYFLLAIFLAQTLPFTLDALYRKYFKPNQFRTPRCLSVLKVITNFGIFANYVTPLIAFVFIVSSLMFTAETGVGAIDWVILNGFYCCMMVYCCTGVIGVPRLFYADISSNPYSLY